MEGDRLLLARAAEFLAEQTPHSIKVTVGGPDNAEPGLRKVTIQTRGLRRLDFYVDGRPEASLNLHVNEDGEATLTPSIRAGVGLRLVGYNGSEDDPAAALYRGQVS